MSFRTVLVAVLALVCGVSASLVVLRMNITSATEKPDMMQVVVAAVDIPRGNTIREDMVTLKDWPKNVAPPLGALTKLEDVVDRVTASGFVRDETIVDVKLAKPGVAGGLASILPEGMRTYTVQTSPASGGAGFVVPGCRVDVVFTMITAESLTGGGMSATLLQNVEVIAVDQLLEAPAENKVEKFSLVTLVVTSEQVKLLSLAQQKGTLALTLRRNDDPNDENSPPVTLSDLPFLQQRPNPSEQMPETEMAQGEAESEVAEAQEVLKPELAPEPPPSYIRTMRGMSAGLLIVRPDARRTVAVPPRASERAGG